MERGGEAPVADGPSDWPSKDCIYGNHLCELQSVHPGSAGVIRASVGNGSVPC